MKLPHRILVLEDDDNALAGIVELLTECGYDVTPASAYEDAKRLLSTTAYDLFVTDIGIFPKIDSQYDEIHDEITHAISDLVQDQPHAFDYLRGRTFARSLH